MSNQSKYVYIRGKVYWCRVQREPHLNFEKTGKQWATDFVPLDNNEKKKLVEIGKNLKDKGDDRGTFTSFVVRAARPDGRPNDPVKVLHPDGITPWDPNVALGNGTVVDIKVRHVNYGNGRRAGNYLQSIRVLELVPYQAQEFAPLDKDDEFAGKTVVQEAVIVQAAAPAAEKAVETDNEDWGESADLNDEVPTF